MYSLVRDGQVVAAFKTFEQAWEAAKMWPGIISLWSGPIRDGRGVCKHAMFIDGRVI